MSSWKQPFFPVWMIKCNECHFQLVMFSELYCIIREVRAIDDWSGMIFIEIELTSGWLKCFQKRCKCVYRIETGCTEKWLMYLVHVYDIGLSNLDPLCYFWLLWQTVVCSLTVPVSSFSVLYNHIYIYINTNTTCDLLTFHLYGMPLQREYIALRFCRVFDGQCIHWIYRHQLEWQDSNSSVS